jgi:hypothetical protein
MPTVAALSRRDVFQLAYLPHVVAAHFNTLLLLDQAGRGASPRLGDAITRAMSALPKRGPEVVSCVMQVERILATHGAASPPPPKLPEECFAWADKISAFVRDALDPRRWDVVTRDKIDPALVSADGANLVVYTMAQRVGDAEQTFRLAALTARLLAEEPGHPMLTAQKQRLEADLVRARERLEGTLRDASAPAARLNRLVPLVAARVVEAILAQPTSPQALDLTVNVVGEAAAVLERAVVAQPFPEIVAEARAGRLPMAALERALAEYPSLRAARQGRTLWVATDGDSPAQDVLRFGPDDVELLVVDAQTPDSCVHFSGERLAELRRLVDGVAVEEAAIRWTGVSLDALVKYPAYRVLLRGDNLRNLVWTDHASRPFIAVFTTDDALEAFLARSPEMTEPVERRWMPGSALFAALAQLDLAGFVLNPAGPGPSRVFNRGTLGALG